MSSPTIFVQSNTSNTHRDLVDRQVLLSTIEMSDSRDNKTTGPAPDNTNPKAANSGYPVDDAELSTQQERLRKAAAAGAHALKSPLSSALSRSPLRPSATPQDPHSPATGLAQTPASSEAVPTALSRMQTSDLEPILAELRKISAWADTQRKITKWSFIFVAVFIPALIGFGLLLEQRFKSTVEEASPTPKADWYDMDRDVRSGDFDKGLALGEELIQKTPQSPDAHKRLAAAYLASGKLDKAKEHYAEAFRLFPSEENQKLLSAIEQRSNAEKQ